MNAAKLMNCMQFNWNEHPQEGKEREERLGFKFSKGEGWKGAGPGLEHQQFNWKNSEALLHYYIKRFNIKQENIVFIKANLIIF